MNSYIAMETATQVIISLSIEKSQKVTQRRGN